MAASSAAAPLRLSISITAFFLLFALLFPSPILCGPISVTSISPNFTASYLEFVDSSAPGAFLTSRNNSFQARLTNPKPESASYYFAVVHVISNTIVWSANRNAPISQSGELRLSSRGLSLYNDTGQISWSTPRNLSSVSSLQLMESGNLVLLDFANNTLWQSFDYPTDVIVVGQRFPIGKSLVSSVSDEDLSEGSYRLSLGENDAMLQWNGISYWKLSMETKAVRDSYSAVKYMMLNFTGVYLIGDGGMVVFQIIPSEAFKSSSDFVMVKLDPYGVLGIVKVDTRDGSREQYFEAPADNCRIPFVCRSCGVCTNGGSCQCAPGFHPDPKSIHGDCVPTNRSLALSAGPCGISSSNDMKEINYLEMREDLDYFSNDFMDPVMDNMNLSACKGLCSRNCSCLGFFYSGNTSFCYMIMDYLGSFLIKSSSSRDANRLGFIKALEERNSGGDSSGKKSGFPITAVVLLPSSGVVLIALVGIIIWLRWRRRKRRIERWTKSPNSLSGRAYSLSSTDRDDINFVSIPGLPVRFDYNELAVVTEGFKNQIGSGGFGTVYKGTLRDGTEVAVKKITCLGSRGNKEFLTEIAVIGKIHHINLVRLKGFCAYRGQRFLVYEFMNRGSLDRTLFGGENAEERLLEWRERYEIALGTARGLAYLHTGCEHKIIHCDVKPENILLHDASQVKISDFGLSKLLSPEQSGLFTTMRGTRGYLAPEWLTSSAISDKTDVYSYGMVLLEIVRGRKNSCVQYTPTNQRPMYFPLFALEMHEEGRYLQLLDPRLAGRVRMEEVERVVRVALCCVHEDPSLRPSMSNVVGMLEGGMPPSEPRVESLNFLRFYGRRFTETSRGEETNNEFVVYGSTTSYNSLSYMSSQQVSGPR
ncbi:G-type lectin S-receptor-like serine/threonine-protein kinase [Striga hermonthica]|uniref:Receptor-like serine/threonine-protein kinase n=1 Tax=Striga hermonthica TaxID=68872 RepID=A0A9N7MQT5_STRHE|nr:G-type lectin S-receptor-like serine/threonine-protein kinase [Striga hermonthica]